MIVALLISRERVTDQTWVYFPDPDIAIGRVHEPKNWSRGMPQLGICSFPIISSNHRNRN